MNRREMLTGIVAAAVAVVMPAVEATATWVELHDGSDFTLDGDFTVEMWLCPCEDRRSELEQLADSRFYGRVDGVALRANSDDGLRRLLALTAVGYSLELADVIVRKYKNFVPRDGEWHHLHVQKGVVFVDGELVDKPEGVALTHHFGDARLTIDGTGDYVAVP